MFKSNKVFHVEYLLTINTIDIHQKVYIFDKFLKKIFLLLTFFLISKTRIKNIEVKMNQEGF